VRLELLHIGLHIPPMIWGTQFQYSFDALLGAFASLAYEPDDYVREYENYLKLV